MPGKPPSQRQQRKRPAHRRSGLQRHSRRRLFGLLVVSGFAFTAIGVKLLSIQALNSGRLVEASMAQSEKSVTLPALRGSILARNGDELALSEMRSTIFADPTEITDAGAEAATLAPVLHETAGVLQRQLTEHTTYVPLVVGGTQVLADAVQRVIDTGALPGIGIHQEPVRYYPAGPLASPLIGFMNTNGAAGGLEVRYDRWLTGQPGKLVEAVDPAGLPIPGSVAEDVPAVNGDDIVTTIDEGLQYQVEQALSKAITTSDGTGGVALVESTRTGQLLAVASLVSNGKGGKPTEALSETAFTNVYEPGSVAKIVTISGALASGSISPGETFVIPNTFAVSGSIFHDAETHPTYVLSTTGVLAQSSNIGAIQIAQRMGPYRLYHYEQAFGLTRPTDIGFPGESAGLVTPLAHWSGTTLPTLAFGEANAETAVQMLGAINTVANGGTYVPPRLVTATVGPDGQEHVLPAPPTRRVVPTWVAKTMAGMLEQVVSNGTGVAAQIPGYAVAGKTGTSFALKPNGTYDTSRYVSSFAGFFPAQAPQVSILVVVDHTQLFGAEAAAPAFSSIARDAVLDLSIPSAGPQPAPSVAAVPHIAGQPLLSYMQP
ncbi:MAG: peptidoglycan D,D-transpeptidase FtsI family protein [Acidimicrobiales bacterium]